MVVKKLLAPGFFKSKVNRYEGWLILGKRSTINGRLTLS